MTLTLDSLYYRQVRSYRLKKKLRGYNEIYLKDDHFEFKLIISLVKAVKYKCAWT